MTSYYSYWQVPTEEFEQQLILIETMGLHLRACGVAEIEVSEVVDYRGEIATVLMWNDVVAEEVVVELTLVWTRSLRNAYPSPWP